MAKLPFRLPLAVAMAAAFVAATLCGCRSYDGAAVAAATTWDPVVVGWDGLFQRNLATGREELAGAGDALVAAKESWGPDIAGWSCSPDGRAAAFLGQKVEDAWERPVVLAEAAPDGTWRFQRITSVRFDTEARTCWSSDGRVFAAMSKEEIVTVDVATRTPHSVHIHPRPVPYWSSPPIALSPDGARAACIYDRVSPLRIVSTADGAAREIPLTALGPNGGAILAGWGPDGRVRVVSKGKIHLVDPDTGVAEVAPIESEWILSATLSPDGAVLVICDGHHYFSLNNFFTDAPWAIRTRVFGAFGERELDRRRGGIAGAWQWTWLPRAVDGR